MESSFQLHLSLWLLLFAAVPVVIADSGSRLVVLFPEWLRDISPNGFSHMDAGFGKRLQGVSIEQPLYYADSDYCDLNSVRAANKIRYYPTSPFDTSNGGAPFLLMINRHAPSTECHFAQQVRNAQHMGAAGVLIADTVPVCIDQVHDNATLAAPCQRNEPVMANDGSGNDITIPSFLLWKRDADYFKQAFVEGDQTVRVELYFPPRPTTHPDATLVKREEPSVALDLWVLPSDLMSLNLIQRFQPAAVAFQERLNFTLHTLIMNGTRVGCRRQQADGEEFNQHFCNRLCTNEGRYCASEPDVSLYAGMTRAPTNPIPGADVVKESLRQLCIWSNAQSFPKTKYLWWSYAREFYQACFSTGRFHDDTCIQQVYEKVGIPGNVIDDCMSNSGGLTNGINSKLEAQLELISDHAIHVLPTLHINGVPYGGENVITADSIFHVVCAHLKYSTLPSDAPERRLCHLCGPSECTDFSGCMEHNGACPDFIRFAPVKQQNGNSNYNSDANATGGVSVFIFLSSIVLLTVLTVLAATWYYQQARARLRDQVHGIVSDYILLDIDDDGTNDGRNADEEDQVTEIIPTSVL